MKKVIWLFLVLVMGLVACNKEEVDPPVPPNPQEVDFDPGAATSASVYGIVTDEQGAAVADATVRMGNKSATTDDNGVFRIENAQVGENLAYVTVDKSGYFQGSRSFKPLQEENPFVKIKLLTLDFSGSVLAATGGRISLPEGVSIDFPADGFVDMTGQAYAGSVNVAARYLDPEAQDIAEIMPGNLYGFSREGETVALATFGMVAVELFGDQGQELQLADGQTALLSMPLSADLLANAPATIPLWHFDETYGIWIEEGEATLVDGKYVGEVSHFSFWNCDAPFPVINMSGSLFWKDPANPMGGIFIRITVQSSSLASFGITNEDGAFGGDIPSDEEMVLEIFDFCGELVHSENIGPFSSDVVLDDIILTEGNFNLGYSNVSGTLVDCDGNPVTNGYVKLTSQQQVVIEYVDASGGFNAGVLTCDDMDFTIVGVDLDHVVQSEVQTYNDSMDPVDVGELEACDIELDEFIEYELDGQSYVLTDYVYAYDSLGTIPGFEVGAYGNASGPSISLWIEGDDVGTFPVVYLYVWGVNQQSIILDPNVTATITEYGNTEEVIRGTFSGDFDDQQGQNHTIEGEFKAIRDF